MELWHSEVLGGVQWREWWGGGKGGGGAEGLFPRQNPKQAPLKLPMIMYGCQFRLAHSSVLLKSGHEVNLVPALSTRSSLSGTGCQRSGRSDKEWTLRAKTFGGCGSLVVCLYLKFIQTDFLTGISFLKCPSVWFHGLFHPPPVGHGFLYFKSVTLHPEYFSRKIIVWGTNFGGKPWKSYHGRSFFAIASGGKYLNKSSPWLPSNASVTWTKLIFISPLRMLAPPRKKTKIGPKKRCFCLSRNLELHFISVLLGKENVIQTNKKNNKETCAFIAKTEQIVSSSCQLFLTFSVQPPECELSNFRFSIEKKWDGKLVQTFTFQTDIVLYFVPQKLNIKPIIQTPWGILLTH